jgi:hypothetical protein
MMMCIVSQLRTIGCYDMTNRLFANSLLFSPESYPYGISYAEWTSRWWQWALSLPVEINPITDCTGKYAAEKQSGPVWFLAGTLGGVATRRCNIPSEKAILLPVLIHGGTLADSPAIKSESELVSRAYKEMDIISDLEVIIDGFKLEDLQAYRILSPVFDVVLPNSNLFNGTPGQTRGASDGYWLFTRPLTKGSHNITSFGSCRSGRVKIGVTYDIMIA